VDQCEAVEGEAEEHDKRLNCFSCFYHGIRCQPCSRVEANPMTLSTISTFFVGLVHLLYKCLIFDSRTVTWILTVCDWKKHTRHKAPDLVKYVNCRKQSAEGIHSSTPHRGVIYPTFSLELEYESQIDLIDWIRNNITAVSLSILFWVLLGTLWNRLHVDL